MKNKNPWFMRANLWEPPLKIDDLKFYETH
jgi:hypothetical protein